MKDFIREILDDSIDGVRDSVRKTESEEFLVGYDQAANICVEIITKKIDELFSQISSNSFLSEREQFLLLKLKEMKSETEEELRDFWSGNE